MELRSRGAETTSWARHWRRPSRSGSAQNAAPAPATGAASAGKRTPPPCVRAPPSKERRIPAWPDSGACATSGGVSDRSRAPAAMGRVAMAARTCPPQSRQREDAQLQFASASPQMIGQPKMALSLRGQAAGTPPDRSEMMSWPGMMSHWAARAASCRPASAMLLRSGCRPT